MTEVSNEVSSKKLLDELVAAVECLVPVDGWALVRDSQVAASEKLRNLAARSGHPALACIADLIAQPSDLPRALEEFDSAYLAYAAEQTLGGADVDPQVALRLHRAVKPVLQAKTRSPFELGRKVKVATIVGLHTLILRTWNGVGLDAAQHYRTLWKQLSPIEPWYLATVVGGHYSPAEWEFGRRGGDFVSEPGFVDELLRFAGATWRAAIAADVKRLNSQSPKEIR